MTKPLIDIGANLTNSVFKDDFDAVLQRATEQGLSHIILTGTSVENSRYACGLASQYPDLLSATAGIHPHDAKDYSSSSYTELLDLSHHPKIKAIGECGLDFNRMYSSKEQQIHAFEQQIELAIERQLPLFLHQRDAHKEQWDILSYYRDQFPTAVMHCFTGAKHEAFGYLDLDLYIGITGWICDERRGHHLHQFVGDIPLDRLMIETDAPYLMPRVKPKPELPSSRRNEPCTLPYVLQEISKHRSESIEQIALATTDNAISFFALNN